MFDRYTESARRAIYSARLAANGSTRIEVDHLLAGIASIEPLFRESPLASALPQTKQASAANDKAMSYGARLVLRYAAEEGVKPHGEVNCLHLALGILREGKSDAARRMREHGFTRGAILSRLPPARPLPPPPWILTNQHVALFLLGLTLWAAIVGYTAWQLNQVVAEERTVRAYRLNLQLVLPTAVAYLSWGLAILFSFLGFGLRSGPFRKRSRILVPLACLCVYLLNRFVLAGLV